MGIKINVDADTKITLEKCPHILIGGSTGSGKSYLMKSMLCDILKSGEAKVLVVDPKSVDFQFLENSRKLEWDCGDGESDNIKLLWSCLGINLLDRDDIDSLSVLKYLNELVNEMYKRYSIMKKYGYIDWSEVMSDELCIDGLLFGNKRIVLMIDELSDLIYWDRQKSAEMLVGYERDECYGLEYGIYEMIDANVWKMMRGTIEGNLIKLSILGRAAGIHLVLGTQRPDASILSGQLRANLPTRICLRVSNKMERRIILGDSGRGYEREMKYLSEDYVLGYKLR